MEINNNSNIEENVVINTQECSPPLDVNIEKDESPTTSLICQTDPINLDIFSIGDFVRCSTKSLQFSGELINIDLISGIILLQEQISNDLSNLHFVKKSGLLSIEKVTHRIQKRRTSNLKHNNSLYTIDEIESRTENILIIEEPLIEDEQAKRTFFELKRIFDDVTWDGSSIFVLKCIRIFHPYDFKSLETIDSRSSSLAALARVQKILEMRRDCRIIPSLLSLNIPLIDIIKNNNNNGETSQITTETSNE